MKINFRSSEVLVLPQAVGMRHFILVFTYISYINLKENDDHFLISISILLDYFTELRRFQRGSITALVSISARVHLCYTRNYTTPLQLTLFDIPGMR